MPWDKNEKEAFPNRHPHEPGGLRQDILDEIADHLACAGEREREKCEDSDEKIERRVLHRFGNPNAIARRLWWDEMRETVMREWIKTGVMVVLALTAVAGVVFMGLMLRQFGATNEAMLKALTQQNGATEARWATLNIEFRRGTKDGPLAGDIKAEVYGKMFDQEGGGRMTLVSDAEGRVSFGPVAPGSYSIKVEDPVSMLAVEKNVVLFPRVEPQREVVVVPDVTPRPVNVTFNVPISTDGGQQRLLARIVSTWKGGGETWTGSQDCLFGPEGGRSLQMGLLPPWMSMVNWEGGRRTRLSVSSVDAYRHPVLLAGAPGQACRAASMRREGDLFWGQAYPMSFAAETGGADGELHAVIQGGLADTIADWALYDQLSAQGLFVSQKLVAAIRRRYPEMTVTATLPVAKSTLGGIHEQRIVQRARNGDAVFEQLLVIPSPHNYLRWGSDTLDGRPSWSPFFQLPEEGLRDLSAGARLVMAFFVAKDNIEEFNNPLEARGVYNDVFAVEWPDSEGVRAMELRGESNLELGEQPLDVLASPKTSVVGEEIFSRIRDLIGL